MATPVPIRILSIALFGGWLLAGTDARAEPPVAVEKGAIVAAGGLAGAGSGARPTRAPGDPGGGGYRSSVSKDGATVPVVVVRDGAEVTLQVTLDPPK